MDFTPDMQIIELDSFDTAFPVQPGKENAVKRRFMTLFASGEQAQVGGTSYVCKVRSFSGEAFALKRLLAANGIPRNANLTPEDAARITQGHAAAFYEEYKNQLLVSHLRGFPKLYGYGKIGDDPAIIMEWVEGVSLRDYARNLAAEGLTASALAVATIGASTLDVLDTAARLDSTLVHRDLSPANILIRTQPTSIDAQAERGSYDICLIDFGSAAENDVQDASFTMSSQVWRNGTPEYAAPEMLTRDIPNIDQLRKSPAIDVFALCSVLYELYAGHTPWRVGEHPETSPYRLKTERPPEAIEPREPADAALVQAIMSGLALDQDARPSVRELHAALQAFIAGIGGPVASEIPAQTRTAEGEAPAAGVLERVLPVGLYTPDSTHLKMASAEEGGRRAGEDIPAFKRADTRAVSRRSFLAGGLVAAVAVLTAGGIAARSCSASGGFDFGTYATADAVWAGEAYYPAQHLKSTDWVLRGWGDDAVSGAEIALERATDREPGSFANGLMRVYDPVSGRYGFLTLVQAEGGLATAWRILPAYLAAGDFSRMGSAGEEAAGDLVAAARDQQTALWGYVGADGAMRVEARFDEARAFACGCAAVKPQGSKLWGAIGPDGAEILPPRFLELGRRSAEGLMAAAEESTSNWGFVTADGEWAIPAAFHRVRRFQEGLAPCVPDKADGLWGFADVDGLLAIPARFADAFPFCAGVAPVQDAETQLWGLIDAQGGWVCEPRFLSLGESVGDLFPAHGSPANTYDMQSAQWERYVDDNADHLNFGYGYVDVDGTWAIGPDYADTLIRTPDL